MAALEAEIEQAIKWQQFYMNKAEAAEAREVELAGALEDMTGTAQGLIVSHRVHTFYPGDATRLADQIDRAEIKLAQARTVLAATPEDALARARVMKEVVSTLEQIAQFQRDKCENAGAEMLFMLLDNKVCAAVAALANLDALGKE